MAFVDDIMWRAAKMDAALSVFGKSKSPNFIQRLFKSKSYQSIDTNPPESIDEYMDVVKNCPLISTPPSVRRSGRKIAVCEKAETDRKLVYQSLKYYQQSTYINKHVASICEPPPFRGATKE